MASKVKAQKVLDYLHEAGVSPERVSRVRAPAGIDIGARSPEEIAVSILAEIVETRARSKQAAVQKSAPSVANKEIRDPVCGMQVNVSSAKFKSDLRGSNVYFCCAACKQAFDNQPEKYAAAVAANASVDETMRTDR